MARQIKQKRGQSEVITTVLLILIGIAAVGIVSVFVINTVRNNLVSTDCVQIAGQLTVNFDSDNLGYYEYSDATNTQRFINASIKRGSKDFNMTGFSFFYGNGQEIKKIRVNGKQVTGVLYIKPDGSPSGDLVYPMPGEKKAYNIEVTNFGERVTKVSVAPILKGSKECDSSEEFNVVQK